MGKVSSYTSWQPLEEVIVGRAYTPDYFDFIEDAQVRNQLQLILAETNEDLNNLQKTCEQYGAVVKRPDLPDKNHFIEWQTEGGCPLPPLTPRDWQISLGDKLLRVLPINELNNICDGYGDQVINPHQKYWETHGRRFDPTCITNGASASCIVRVGTDVFFDNSDYLTPVQSRWIQENCLDSRYTFHEAITDGHGDAVFAILKPGVLLSSKWDDQLDLDSDFPGWDVSKLECSTISHAMAVGKFKEENFNGAWYVQGQTPTKEFTHFVDTYLKDWVGYVSDTVFDVNCLVLDEENVIFSAYNKQVFDYCEKHRINPIISELRHSYFWDGGVSCCTQDIRRKGSLETYL
jgi:glycine amidinotransferase/scyllo-inosamine-4-phosphate amidinotransferase 1